MPAFMTIGKLDEESEVVDPGEIKGDTTASWHEGWMMISAFSIDMKNEERRAEWEQQQEKKQVKRGAAKDKKEKKDEKKDSKKEKKTPRENTLTVSKPTDSASFKIFQWAKTPERQDIQIDCCTTEEEWPFLTMIRCSTAM